MMLTRKTFRGPWAGLPVAWTDDDRYDEKTYRGDVARCCAAKIPGVYTGGTTGEFYALEYEEFTAITDTTIAECKQGGTPVMIGCSTTFTRGTIRRARYARDKGADAIQIALPFWMALTDDEILRFVVEVAAAVPGLPISIYETQRAKRAIPLEVHRKIHAAVPTVISIKSNENTVGCTPEGCAALSEFCNVFVGEDLLSELGPSGAVGCCSSLIYFNPRMMMKMFDLLYAGKWNELQPMTDQVKYLLSEGLKTLFERGHLDSSLDRLMGRSAGFLKTSLRCRAPYSSCTEKDLEYLQKWIRKNMPEWLEL